jgi:hypothetical protein
MGRLLAAQRIASNGWTIPDWPDTSMVPVLAKVGLTDGQKRAYRILDNRVAEDSGWDDELLTLEIADLALEKFNLDLTGLETDELDDLLKVDIEGAHEERQRKIPPRHPDYRLPAGRVGVRAAVVVHSRQGLIKAVFVHP